MFLCIPHSLVVHPSVRSRDTERVELNLREHPNLGMVGRKGPRESEKEVWKVRGQTGTFRVMQVRPEERFAMKTVFSGEVKKGRGRKRTLELMSGKLLAW